MRNNCYNMKLNCIKMLAVVAGNMILLSCGSSNKPAEAPKARPRYP